MTNQNRTQEVLDQVGLNWTVRQESITTESGIIVPKSKAIVREDTNTVLSVHGEGYFPYQNHQMVELLDKVSQQIGLPIHKGGYFGEGEKVYLQLKSNDLKLGGDKIEGFITGVNSFDGSTSLAFGPSNITISCMNICRGLEGVLQEEKEMFGDIKRLSETRFTKETEDWVAKLLFNISKEVSLNDDESLSTVTQNRLTRFYVDLNGELKEKGDNLWGLFSGVTKYTTHSLTKQDNSENKMFGTYGNRERQIFKELVELV